MSEQTNSSNRNIIRSIMNGEGADIVSDVAEVFLDENIPNEFLKEIPGVGILFKLAKAKESVSEQLFIRKLMRFLKELHAISPEDREKFVEKYQNNPEELQELGENLALAIERLDDIKKPEILAKFFIAYIIKSEIDYATFTRLAHALDKFNMALLQNLIDFYKNQNISQEIIQTLSSADLISANLRGLIHAGHTTSGGAKYQASSLGKDFLRLGFNIADIN